MLEFVEVDRSTCICLVMKKNIIILLVSVYIWRVFSRKLCKINNFEDAEVFHSENEFMLTPTMNDFRYGNRNQMFCT